MGIKVGIRGLVIYYLMFADDLFLFDRATCKPMNCVKDVFNKFYIMSGQKVSNDKTRIVFSKNKPIHIKREHLRLSVYKEAS